MKIYMDNCCYNRLLDDRSYSQIYYERNNGLSALKEALGVTGTIKFLEQFDQGGTGDYTAEKYIHEEPEPTDEEIRRMFGF